MFFVLLLFFILLSGKVTMEIVLFGLGIAILVSLFCWKFMGWNFKKEMDMLRRFPKMVWYAAVLFVEIVKANFVTIKRIFSGREMEPAIVTIHTSLKEEKSRVLLANSITLTPGTITLDCEGDKLTIHCLDKQDADSLDHSDLEMKIAKLEDAK